MGAVGYTSGDPRKLNRTGYTKGDVVAANATGALTAIPVGADTEVLTADSTDAEGVDWTAGGGGAGTPSATVVAETAYGQASTAGVAAAYSRGDHTHGTPSLTSTPPATTHSIGQAAAVGVGTTPARHDHVHPLAAAGAPVASAVGDTQATGVATTFAASDHRHAREAFGTVTAQTSFGLASSDGVATTVARSDHTHGTPAGQVDPNAGALGVELIPAPHPAFATFLALGSGNALFVLVYAPRTVSITTLAVVLQQGGTTSSGVNGLAAYTEAGVLIDQTGDMSVAFGSAGYKEAAVSGGSIALTANTRYYLGVLTHFSGGNPNAFGWLFGNGTNYPVINTHRPSVFLTAQATFPASFDPSTANVNTGGYMLMAR
jgi:hypothetical protein